MMVILMMNLACDRNYGEKQSNSGSHSPASATRAQTKSDHDIDDNYGDGDDHHHVHDFDDHDHGKDDCIRKKTSSLAANRGRYMAKASQTSSQSHHITPASQQVYFYSKAQRKKSSLDPYVQPV